ncbi:hypothetical protein [Salinispora arenicola]|uniref:hypothetical protein n=1 Tax=Salinispora arenicola TaxID=168697 RepID=UPI0035560DDA
MQAQHSHGVAYYRCRFPQEYAIANKVDHPRNVILREDVLVTPLTPGSSENSDPYNVATPSPNSSTDSPRTHPPQLQRRRQDRPWPSTTRSWRATGRRWKRVPTPPSSPAGSPRHRPNDATPRNASARQPQPKPRPKFATSPRKRSSPSSKNSVTSSPRCETPTRSTSWRSIATLGYA